jgi:hypothetical protein
MLGAKPAGIKTEGCACGIVTVLFLDPCHDEEFAPHCAQCIWEELREQERNQASSDPEDLALGPEDHADPEDLALGPEDHDNFGSGAAVPTSQAPVDSSNSQPVHQDYGQTWTLTFIQGQYDFFYPSEFWVWDPQHEDVSKYYE